MLPEKPEQPSGAPMTNPAAPLPPPGTAVPVSVVPAPKSALAKYGPYIAALVIIAAIVAIALH